MPGHRTHPTRFSPEADRDEVIRSTLGRAVHGAADVGEVLAAVADVHAKDHEAWFAAWRDLGERVAAQGDASAAEGQAGSGRGGGRRRGRRGPGRAPLTARAPRTVGARNVRARRGRPSPAGCRAG
ncbi:hypothetical protein [Cellulomonas sp. Y8]|uniref:hypothetical protein n=1 Tax=Cellulomonas sp. Y8 TaxID=2591145 RepID=UPI003D70ABAD